MKHHPLLVVACLLALPVFSGCPATLPNRPANQPAGAEIHAVIEQVKQAIGNVQNELHDNELPQLKSVELTLQTVASSKGGGTLTLWVITLGDTVEREFTQQIHIKLEPPKPGTRQKVAAVSLTEGLEKAIISAARGAQGAKDDAVALNLTGLDVEMKFTVKNTGSGGIKIGVAPTEAELKGEASVSSVHTLNVSFGVAEK